MNFFQDDNDHEINPRIFLNGEPLFSSFKQDPNSALWWTNKLSDLIHQAKLHQIPISGDSRIYAYSEGKFGEKFQTIANHSDLHSDPSEKSKLVVDPRRAF